MEKPVARAEGALYDDDLVLRSGVQVWEMFGVASPKGGEVRGTVDYWFDGFDGNEYVVLL